MFLLEAGGKDKLLYHDYKKYGPEEKSGVFNKAVFWWLKDLLIRGRKNILALGDLYPLNEDLSTGNLLPKFQTAWERAGEKAGRYRALYATFRALLGSILVTMIPRVCLIGFNFCQPLLIRRFTKYLQQPVTENTTNQGYGLIGAYGNALFLHTERIMYALRQMHEVWANIIEVGLASWLLYTQVGFACFAPLVIAAGCGTASFWLSSRANIHQREWMSVIQQRVATTAATFSAIKGVKMLGLTEKLFKTIHALRLTELKSAKAFRQVEVITAFFAFLPEMISPVVTFAIFINVANHGNGAFASTVVYTSISTLLLETQPLTQLFQVIPQLAAAISSFGHKRENIGFNASARSETFMANTEDIPLDDLDLSRETKSSNLLSLTTTSLPNKVSIKIQGGAFGWIENHHTLHDIDIEFPKAQLTMVIGPVASGKSTLCNAILGEIPFSEGIIQLSSSQIALCDQTPFLTNATLRENIIGSSVFDSLWYDSVINAVSLSHDLNILPSGDQTLVGANGLGLSGGQKQRVSIARAVYARNDIAIFDDVFNGLDATTKQRVFNGVFSSNGLLCRKPTTIVLFTNDVDLIHFADHVVALGTNGTVIEQGSPQLLLSRQGYTQRLVTSNLKVVESNSEANAEAPTAPDATVESTEQAVNVSAVTTEGNNNTDFSVYWYYFTSIGLLNMIPYLFFAASFGFFYNFPLVWLSWWSEANDKNTMYLTVYTALVFMMIGQAIIIAVASPYLAISYPVLCAILYYIQKFYLRTSRQLRLLELDAKSPLYTHFLETLRGLRTIRAFNWTAINQELNSKLLDTSQSPVYLLFMVQQWLAVILNLVTTAIVIILVGVATVTRSHHSYIGLALVNLMSFNTILKQIVILWTTLETSIGSVSRIKTFGETTESENETSSQEMIIASEDWPQNGSVEFINAWATYNNPVLKNVELSIKPGEKIGICGKSGSGKSSLTLTLFRMLDLSHGSITIDNIDISLLPREKVRAHLNAIPQEPFFLKGTFRENLDPHQVSNDASLMKALKMVSLESIIPRTGNLDSEMDAEILSHGQRQLFCLARAIVRPARILIMDEATSKYVVSLYLYVFTYPQTPNYSPSSPNPPSSQQTPNL
ncbi:hypothetical protein SS1G_05336 [Sclerotinia sclerotiorum 1980 UF-70]|uniref:ABC transporter n=1 Tax=Sclerotinia sclerotiorum (strain ATCC 18683 / 1980 / Ss-1) TaxID=665079 RepID=A7EJ43_SCLS1|nr:hypothetical protein SS1G_05336 [Sclerotinia sclerotiorum 1980 UF-70]EDO02859.1 hypothetical protein SS1G_05336 [Sclerotinia sclerotiorum 1980 UF-70]